MDKTNILEQNGKIIPSAMHLVLRYNLLFVGSLLFLSCLAFLLDQFEGSSFHLRSRSRPEAVASKNGLLNDTPFVPPMQHNGTNNTWDFPEISNRSARFPTVEDRVRLYMSDWYLPPCPDHRIRFSYQPDKRSHIVTRGNGSDEFFMSNFSSLFTFSLDQFAVQKCAEEEQKSYCIDVVESMLPALQNLNWTVDEKGHTIGEPPVIMHFGDSMFSSSISIPVIQKFRPALRGEEINQLTSANDECSLRNPRNPIIWKLNTNRHYGSLRRVHVGDTAWVSKIPRAIFRGTLTGITDHAMSIVDPVQRCLAIPRCRLVYKHANSSLLDARLTNLFGKFPENLTNVPLVAPREPVESLLRYKALVFLQGNDVSSGVKWGLYSQSVVLMPPPSYTSWAMEELLEPWIHYIPIRPDLQDVEEKIQWVLENDMEAAKISFRGKVWMHDLALHPAVPEEEKRINREILERYRMHWYSTD